jgi:hypothetical protein
MLRSDMLLVKMLMLMPADNGVDAALMLLLPLLLLLLLFPGGTHCHGRPEAVLRPVHGRALRCDGPSVQGHCLVSAQASPPPPLRLLQERTHADALMCRRVGM